MDGDHRLVVTPIRLRLTKKTRIPSQQQLMWSSCYRNKGMYTKWRPLRKALPLEIDMVVYGRDGQN